MLTAAFVVDSPTYGGAEAYVGHLLRRLPAGIDATLVATTPAPDRLLAAAQRCRLVLTSADRLPVTLAATGVDVIHVNGIDPCAQLPVLQAALDTGAAVVPTVHMTDRFARCGPSPALTAAYAGCAAVLAVSSEIARLLAGPYGVAAHRIRHVVNGVDPVPAIRRPEPGTLRIGGLGRLTRQKGYDVLVEAVRRLDRPVEVVVAGEGRERAALEELAAGVPISFPGRSDRTAEFLRGLDVFVHPTRADALPLALLEALMTGLPAIVSDVGDVGLLGDGVLRVTPEDPQALADALELLAADAGRRAALARRGRAAALIVGNADRMARQTFDVLAGAAARPAVGAA